MPSTDTTVSNPRTARLDRIRSTMLGSSSTTRAQVLRVPSAVITVAAPLAQDGAAAGGRTASARARPRSGRPARVGIRLDRQVHLEAGALGQRDQLDPAAVGLHDPLGDGQAEAGAC